MTQNTDIVSRIQEQFLNEVHSNADFEHLAQPLRAELSNLKSLSAEKLVGVYEQSPTSATKSNDNYKESAQ